MNQSEIPASGGMTTLRRSPSHIPVIARSIPEITFNYLKDIISIHERNTYLSMSKLKNKRFAPAVTWVDKRAILEIEGVVLMKGVTRFSFAALFLIDFVSLLKAQYIFSPTL